MSKFGMDFTKLLGAIDTVSKKSYDDEGSDVNFWKLTMDKAGNGSAVIRFLPNKDIQDFPFVRRYSRSFKVAATGKWYIENCRSTIGEADPVNEHTQELYQLGESGDKEAKARASLQKRKLSYISNIKVIKDPANPENDGKIFKFRYGKSIFDMIVAQSKPVAIMNDEGEEEIPEAVNAFDLVAGCAMSLKSKTENDFLTYKDSTFLKSKPIGTEKEMEAIVDALFDLNEEIAPSKFKSYDELKQKYEFVYKPKGAPGGGGRKPASDDSGDDTPQAPEKKAAPAKPKAVPKQLDASDDDSDEAFFRSLAE